MSLFTQMRILLYKTNYHFKKFGNCATRILITSPAPSLTASIGKLGPLDIQVFPPIELLVSSLRIRYGLEIDQLRAYSINNGSAGANT